VDLVHGFSYSRIIHYSRLFQRSYKKVPRLLGNQLQSRISQSNPWFLKINSREVPSPRKINKIVLQASNPHIFPTTTPNSVILMLKIPKSLLILFFTSIIHMFVAFIYCLCLFVLGTVALSRLLEIYRISCLLSLNSFLRISKASAP
jgi:hypothetical protein